MEFGYLTGVYLSGKENDSTVKKLSDRYGVDMNEVLNKITFKGKKVPNFAYISLDEYIYGLILGFLENSKIIDEYMESQSKNEELINGISFLLSYYKIFGFLIKENEEYKLKIKKDRVKNLGKNIEKKERDVYFDEIISIEYVEPTKTYVYDLTVEKTRNFQLFNGLNVRDTFHKAGQCEKQVTAGVPRFQELLNATKNPKIVNCKIYFKEGNKSLQELRNTINHNITCLTLKDLSENIEIVLNKESEVWYEAFKILYDSRFEEHEHCISIKLKKKLLYKYRINIQEIANKIEDVYEDLHCVFSNQEECQLDIFIDVSKIRFSEKQMLFITDENSNEIYIEECVLPLLEKMVIFGIPGIDSIYYIKDDKVDEEWCIETDGTNFRKLLGHKIINMTRVHSNNVWDIYENLGIEAAREFLMTEFESIMEGINMCHVKLLVDKMTFTGTINSISRYTLRKDSSGPISKSSFEESVDVLVKAGFAGEVEKTRGISASIVCGKRGNMGTGFMDLKVDIKQLKNAIPLFKDKDNDGVVLERKAIQPMSKVYTGLS